MNTISKKLPLHIQNDINGYLFYAFPYSIMSAFPAYKNYLMENYVQCFGFMNDANHITFDYADGIGYNDMFHQCGPLDITFDSYTSGIQLDIEAYIISAIENNYYITIFIDQYYIEGRQAYQDHHLLHEILIFGYDDEKFYYLAFNENEKFAFSSFCRKQLDAAYKAGYNINTLASTDWIRERSIILIKPKTLRNSYHFSGERFVLKLKSYLNGEFSDFYNSFVISKERCQIGVYNTNILKQCISDTQYDINDISYPLIHAWYESKRNLLNKIQYYYLEMNYNNSTSDKLLIEYEKKVERQSNALRLLFLKYRRSKTMHKINRNWFIQLLNDIFNSEIEIIEKIIFEIKRIQSKDRG